MMDLLEITGDNDYSYHTSNIQLTSVALQRDCALVSNAHKVVLAGIHSTPWE